MLEIKQLLMLSIFKVISNPKAIAGEDALKTFSYDHSYWSHTDVNKL